MAIRPEHIAQLQGRSYVVFPGLLNLAHESGLRSIETKLVQIPAADNGNCAIVQASALFSGDNGDSLWSAYGDASPANTRGPIQSALIRMAETRAVGRVLRMACNVGETMLEELGGDDETPTNGRAAAPAVATVEQTKKARPEGDGPPVTCDVCGVLLNKNMITRSQHNLKRNLCVEHCNELMKAKA